MYTTNNNNMSVGNININNNVTTTTPWLHWSSAVWWGPGRRHGQRDRVRDRDRQGE
jgi:hypothetical protein